MPIYQYEGQHFDLPDGLSNEDAIAKIEAHLGKTPATPVATPTQPSLLTQGQPTPEQSGKALTGLGEAGVGMLAGMPSMIAGGLAGLGTYLSGQGIDKAAQQVQDIQKSNFGCLLYTSDAADE